nr:EOG090X0DHL [Chydorus sphaericus]
MFVLTLLRPPVEFLAEKFHLDHDQAISETLNKKFANKVLLNVGLCIALWDITKRGESFIMPGRSGHHTKVEFRFVVFRPFMEEILVGKVKSCNKEHVQVTLGFFDDIIIPADSLQKESHFSEKENVWVWKFTNDDGEHDLPMDPGESIR